MKSPRIGRPPIPKKQAKARLLSVRFSFEDWPAINRAARAANESLSDWSRRVLLAAAGVTTDGDATATSAVDSPGDPARLVREVARLGQEEQFTTVEIGRRLRISQMHASNLQCIARDVEESVLSRWESDEPRVPWRRMATLRKVDRPLQMAEYERLLAATQLVRKHAREKHGLKRRR